MLTFAAPVFLLAGALLALLPPAIHLLRRQPPARMPLPTARFLSPDARRAVRVSRPTDLPLMALRMLFLLLLGAALARPSWTPLPRGVTEVVLLDRSASTGAEAWARAVDVARGALLAPDGTTRGELVLFDTAAERIPRLRLTAATFDSLAAAGAGDAPPDLAAGFRAVPAAAADLRGADSIRVRLVSTLPAAGWTAGAARVRRAAWPGAVEIADFGQPAAAAEDDPAAPADALVVAAGGEGAYVQAALRALGHDVRLAQPDAAASMDDAGLIVALAPPADAEAVLGRAERGAALILTPGAAPPFGGAVPWHGGDGPAEPAAGALRFAADVRPDGAASRAPGRPASDARVVAAWEDGRAAAAARVHGGGCIVFVATELEDGGLPLSPHYPLALRRLASACEAAEAAADDARLDAGAIALLRGEGLPASVAAGAAAGEGAVRGIALGRWLLALALAAALVETFVAYRHRSAA